MSKHPSGDFALRSIGSRAAAARTTAGADLSGDRCAVDALLLAPAIA